MVTTRQQAASPHQASNGPSDAKHGEPGPEMTTCTNGRAKFSAPRNIIEDMRKARRSRVTRIKIVNRGNRSMETPEEEIARDAGTVTDTNASTDTNMADLTIQDKAMQAMLMIQGSDCTRSSGDEVSTLASASNNNDSDSDSGSGSNASNCDHHDQEEAAALEDLPLPTQQPTEEEFIEIYDDDTGKIKFLAHRPSDTVLYNRFRAGDQEKFLQFYYGGKLIALADLDEETYVYEQGHELGEGEEQPWADVYRGSTRVASWNLATHQFMGVFKPRQDGESGRRRIIIKTW